MARVLFNLAVSAATLAIAAMSALPASAASLTWTLNNVQFFDGSTASGSFNYDGTDFTNINIQVSPGREGFYSRWFDDWGFDPYFRFPAHTYTTDNLSAILLGFHPAGSYSYTDSQGSYLSFHNHMIACCGGAFLRFSTPLYNFSSLADHISGGTASVDLWLVEEVSAKAYSGSRRSRPGAYVSTTFPTRYERAPEPSMILGSVAGGVALIALRRKRAKSNQSEP